MDDKDYPTNPLDAGNSTTTKQSKRKPYVCICHGIYSIIVNISNIQTWLWYDSYAKTVRLRYDYHCDVTWVPWLLKSPTTGLLVQQFVQAGDKGNIKNAHYWSFASWIHRSPVVHLYMVNTYKDKLYILISHKLTYAHFAASKQYAP